MNPGRLRRRALQLVAALTLGLGLYAIGTGIANAQDNSGSTGSAVTSVSTTDGGEGTVHTFDSTWW